MRTNALRVANKPTPTPSLIEPFEGQTVEVVAQGFAFNTKEISVKAGGKVRIRLTNKDKDAHNIWVIMSRSDQTPVAPGSESGLTQDGGVIDTVFDLPAPGTYYFRCEPHDNMNGTFAVVP